MHKGVNILIRRGYDRHKGFNKDGNIEPHVIVVDLENILEKLIIYIFIFHFPVFLK